jgi:hypothetical protein
LSRLHRAYAIFEVIRRIVRAGQQQVNVWGAVSPYAPMPGAAGHGRS